MLQSRSQVWTWLYYADGKAPWRRETRHMWPTSCEARNNAVHLIKTLTHGAVRMTGGAQCSPQWLASHLNAWFKTDLPTKEIVQHRKKIIYLKLQFHVNGTELKMLLSIMYRTVSMYYALNEFLNLETWVTVWRLSVRKIILSNISCQQIAAIFQRNCSSMKPTMHWIVTKLYRNQNY